MTDTNKNAWLSFREVVSKYLENKKDSNYRSIVENLFVNFQKLGCRMSVKVPFLHFHLDYFPSNLGAMSEEQDERFYQDIKIMKTRYQGRWNCSMMTDYCWSLKCDCH